MDDHTTNAPLKQCTKCHEWKPATTEYFYRSRSRKDGFTPWCKDCQREQKGQKKRQPLVVDGMIRCASGENCRHPLGALLPATTEYFSLEGDRLRGTCRYCRKARVRDKYNSDPNYRERTQERNRRSRGISDRAIRYKTAQKQKRMMHKDGINLSIRIRRATDEDWRDQQNSKRRTRYKTNEEYRRKAKENRKRWYEKNRDVARANHARYRAENRDALLEQRRQYSRSEQGRLTAKRWAENNRIHRVTYDNNRTARLRNLPSTLTRDQFDKCLEWWNYSCAYCGAQRDFWNTLQVEHFIPVTNVDCPGTTVNNVLPSCKYCNTSKNNRDAREWLTDKFGKRHAREILKRIQTYFDSLE